MNHLEWLRRSREPDTTERDIATAYRSAFSGHGGEKVLCHMLVELGFFNQKVTTPEEIACYNYAVQLLRHMGIWTAENVPLIVRGLLSIPYRDKQENDDA